MTRRTGNRRLVAWTIALVASLGVATGATGAATVGDATNPPDPMGAPGRYALARSDSLWVASGLQPSGGSGTYADLNTSMNGFTATGSPADVPAHGGSPESYPMIHGRFTDPAEDQVLSLLNSGTAWSAASPTNPNLPAWSEPVAAGTSSEPPQALAAGDLDRVLSNDDNYYDEAVAVFAGANHTLQVRVLDYQAETGKVTATSLQLGQLGGIYWQPTNSYGEGPLAVGIGDFDGDGMNEIAVAVNRNGTLELELLRYTRTLNGPSLQSLHSIALADDPSALWIPSYRMTVGDLDGVGPDEIALARAEADGDPHGEQDLLATITVVGLDDQLALAKLGYMWTMAGGWIAFDPPSPGGGDSGPKVAAGLFHYAPDPTGQSGFTISRDGLAFAWASRGDMQTIQLRVFDVVPGSSACPDLYKRLVRQQCNLELQPYTPALTVSPEYEAPAVANFSLAAGGFVGPVNADESPATWGLAVGIDGAGVSFYRPASGQLTKTFSTSQWPGGYNLVNYDRQGKSVYLGAPVVFTIDGLVQTTMIVQDAPKHADWLPAQKSWLNVDRTDQFEVDVSSDTSQAFESTTKTSSDHTIGGSASLSLEASVTSGLVGIDDEKETVKASVAVDQSYEEKESEYNADTSSYSLEIDSGTGDDDLIGGSDQPFYVFRYPIFGSTYKDENNDTMQGMYEIVIPGEPTPINPPTGGRNFDWYSPPHENGNVLSYPKLASGPAPVPMPDMGTYTVGTKDFTNGLFNSAYFVDPTVGDVDLKIQDQTVATSSRDTQSTLKKSADLSVSISGKYNVGFAKGEASATVDLAINSTNSWSKLSTSTQTSKSASDFKLKMDQAAMGSQAYQAGTAYYYAQDGTEKVAHAVDVTASEQGRNFWFSIYGGRPDPALNLPFRINMTKNQNTGAMDIPTWNDSASHQLIRGFEVVHPNDAPAAVAGALFSNPADGDKVQLQVPVRNYSLDTAITELTVRFSAVPVNADDTQITGPEVQIGDVQGLTIPPQGTTTAAIEWDTTGRGPTTPGASQNYRVFVVLDPGNTITNEIHEWADRYDYPPTVTGKSGGTRIVDPRTGNLEVLESGQNNQGYGEIAIMAKNASEVVGSEAPDVRLARDAITASMPRALPRREGAHGLVDRSLELRVRVDADRTAPGFHRVLIYDGHPDAGGTVIAGRTVRSLGEHGIVATANWVPRTPGMHHIYARLIERADDPQQGNAHATLAVTVAPPATVPATLRELRAAVRHGYYVVNPLERRLLKRIDRATLDLRRGRRANAKRELAQLVKLLGRAQGKSISRRDARSLVWLARRVSAKVPAKGGQRR